MMANDSENENIPLRGAAIDDKLDVITRHGFIRKVFTIVFAQLCVTAAMAYPFVVNKKWAVGFVQDNSGLLTVAAFLPLALICYSWCNPSILREYPKNYFFLGIFTTCFGVIVGLSVVRFPAEVVGMAVGVTLVITIALTIFAMQTTYDFSGMGPYLLVAFLCLVMTSCFLSLFGGSNMAHQALSGLFVMMFMFYIVYDVQLISGGKHQTMRFGLDEYAFAALVLYMDIINLFLHILQLFGRRD